MVTTDTSTRQSINLMPCVAEITKIGEFYI